MVLGLRLRPKLCPEAYWSNRQWLQNLWRHGVVWARYKRRERTRAPIRAGKNIKDVFNVLVVHTWVSGARSSYIMFFFLRFHINFCLTRTKASSKKVFWKLLSGVMVFLSKTRKDSKSFILFPYIIEGEFELTLTSRSIFYQRTLIHRNLIWA